MHAVAFLSSPVYGPPPLGDPPRKPLLVLLFPTRDPRDADDPPTFAARIECPDGGSITLHGTLADFSAFTESLSRQLADRQEADR